MRYRNIATCILFIVTMFSTSLIHAGILSCGTHTINNMYINAGREDNYKPNTLEIFLNSTCNGATTVYIEMTNPAYNSVLSTTLMAFTTGTQIHLYINESKINEIALMQLTK